MASLIWWKEPQTFNKHIQDKPATCSFMCAVLIIGQFRAQWGYVVFIRLVSVLSPVNQDREEDLAEESCCIQTLGTEQNQAFLTEVFILHSMVWSILTVSVTILNLSSSAECSSKGNKKKISIECWHIVNSLVWPWKIRPITGNDFCKFVSFDQWQFVYSNLVISTYKLVTGDEKIFISFVLNRTTYRGLRVDQPSQKHAPTNANILAQFDTEWRLQQDTCWNGLSEFCCKRKLMHDFSQITVLEQLCQINPPPRPPPQFVIQV